MFVEKAVEKEILEKAVRALQRETGIIVGDCKQVDGRGDRTDYELSLSAPDNENGPRKFLAEVKKNVGGATVGEAARQAAQTLDKFVLVAEYITEPQAQKLRELNVSFFDTAGNAYFAAPGLYVFVTGKKTSVSKDRMPRLLRPPGMRILFAFLNNDSLEKESYRRISAATNVPTPTVGLFMTDLEKAGYLTRRSKNERFLVRKNELLKRWVTVFGESFRQTLKPIRFRSTKHQGRWWEEVDLTQHNAVWGGETGGAMLTAHLKPELATIYADSVLPKLQAQYGLVRDERGNVEILKKFWTNGEVSNAVAPPLVVYADLIADADERNLETAAIIYERYLAGLTKSAS